MNCSKPDKFGGHHKPFVLVTEHLRLCTGCGAVDDHRSEEDFARRRSAVTLTEAAKVAIAAKAHGVEVRWADL